MAEVSQVRVRGTLYDIKDTVARRGSGSSPAVASTAAGMTDTSKIYVYTGSETGYTAGNWYYYDGTSWVSGGIYQSSGIETDTTLAVSGAAADSKATGDAINNVIYVGSEVQDSHTRMLVSPTSSELEVVTKTELDTELADLKNEISSKSGLSEDLKLALDNFIKYVAFKDNNPLGQVYIDAVHDALYPPTNLSRISAVYLQTATVFGGDDLNSLKPDLTVTAYYTDGTSKTISNYALSGELSQNPSTITVSYSGQTTTFSVRVVQPVFDYDSKRDGLLSEKAGVYVDKATNYSYTETLSSSNNLRIEGKTSGGSLFVGYQFGDTPTVASVWRLRIRAELYTLGETTGPRCLRPQISNVTNAFRVGCHLYGGAARFSTLEGETAVNIFSGIEIGDVWHDIELYGDPTNDVFTVSVDGVEKYRTTADHLATAQVTKNALYIIGKCLIFIRSIRLYNE